jgi:hypothetical protein
MNVGWMLLVSQLAWSGIVGEIKIGPDSVRFAFPGTYDSLAKSVDRRKLSYDTLVDDFDRDGSQDRVVRVHAGAHEQNLELEDALYPEGWALYSGQRGESTWKLVWSRSISPGCTYPSGCSLSWSAKRGCVFWGWSGGSMAGSWSFVHQYRYQDGEFRRIGSVTEREEADDNGSPSMTTKTDWNLVTGRQIEEISRWRINDEQEVELRKKTRSEKNVKPKGGKLPILGEPDFDN